MKKKISKLIVIALIFFSCMKITGTTEPVNCTAIAEQNNEDIDWDEKKKQASQKAENAKEKAGETYDNVKEKTGDIADKAKDTAGNMVNEGEDALDDGINGFWESFYQFHAIIKSCMPFIFTLSIISGMLLFVFARKNKGIRQWALLTLCVFIPGILLLLVYGLPYIKPLGCYTVDQALNNKTIIEEVTDTSSSVETMAIYSDVKERVALARQAGADSNLQQKVYQFWIGYEAIRAVLNSTKWSIIVGSEVLGILITLLCQKDKKTKRWAKVSLCGVVPAVVLIFIYLVPILEKIFI